MTARYDPNALIETLFEQITDGVAYAELGDAPFTSKQIVDISLLCLAKTRGVSRQPEGVEPKATPQPRLDHIQGALCESTPRVEGKLVPHRRTTFSPSQRRQHFEPHDEPPVGHRGRLS